MTNLPDYTPRTLAGTSFERKALADIGLTSWMITQGILYTYRILDIVDNTLIERDAFRLSQMMELANLSTFVGNLLGAGIANASKGVFKRNGPHKYPDLLAQTSDSKNVEIKVALEDNKPKGHLAKPGYYITCRYILGDRDGSFLLGSKNRGDVVWIWELRCGHLEEMDFNTSNTEGDSGKTAVVNKSGMTKLEIIYLDMALLPFSPRGRVFRDYQAIYSPRLDLPE